jgi:hypothetical protein
MLLRTALWVGFFAGKKKPAEYILIYYSGLHLFMAEREGFEPSMGVNPYTLSRRAPSAARTPLHFFIIRGYYNPSLSTTDFVGYFLEAQD